MLFRSRAELESEFQRLRDLQQDGLYPYRSLIAEHLDVIDPAGLTANDLFRELARRQLFATPQSRDAVEKSKDLFFVSVPAASYPGIRLAADGGLEKSWKYGRTVDQHLLEEDTEVVPLSAGLLPESSRQLIQQRLPAVASRLLAP